MFKYLPLCIDVVDIDGVDDVDTEKVVVLEYLLPCLDIVGFDGVFEGDLLDSYLIHCNNFLPYVNSWFHVLLLLLFPIDRNTQ